MPFCTLPCRAVDADRPEAERRPAKGHETCSYLLTLTFWPLTAGRAARGSAQPGPPLGIMLRMTLPGSGAPTSPTCRCSGASSPRGRMNWFTRKVPAWHISDTLEADFCVGALNEAICRVGPAPDHEPRSRLAVRVRRLDRPAEAGRLKRTGTRIPMDGKGRCLDNVFIERLWRSPKSGCVCLHAWETGRQAKGGHWPMDDPLHPPAAPCRPWRTAPRCAPLQPDRNDEQAQRPAQMSPDLAQGSGSCSPFDLAGPACDHARHARQPIPERRASYPRSATASPGERWTSRRSAPPPCRKPAPARA